MKKYIHAICLFWAITSNSFGQITVGLTQHDEGTQEDGYVLFAPLTSTKTYLIDKCGEQIKTWSSDYKPGVSCYLLPDGNLLRTGNVNNATFTAGGNGGIIEKIDWNGTVTWSYTISSDIECQHHDVRALPNGNVLAIVWEAKTKMDAIEQGRDPALSTTTIWSEKIIEIEPVGLTGGNIVWEWHLWDHLVQDFDNTKSNYGTISANPQLININYNASANPSTGEDWIHLNSIDYNESLDQILLSSHTFDEIWIIDHSTTTAEAASHSGGNSTKGGDILYRWGNPQAYANGTAADQKFFGQHNAHWIENGLPYQNEIMVFNNGLGRTDGNYSSIEIILPPVDGYNYTANLPYAPSTNSWNYNASNTVNFYAKNISGAQQMANGNVLFCNGPSGTFTEVSSNGITKWNYVNPVTNSGVINQGDSPTQNTVFRATFYPNTYSGFSGRTLNPQGSIENTNSNTSSCTLSANLEEIKNLKNSIQIYPNPTQHELTIAFGNDLQADLTLEIVDNSGRILYKKKMSVAQKIQTVDLSHFPTGSYFTIFKFENQLITKKLIVE